MQNYTYIFSLKIFKTIKLIAAGPADQPPTVKLSKYLIQVSNK